MSEDSDFRERHLRKDDFLGTFGVLETPQGVVMVRNRRRIAGQDVLVWDLPGGQVEPGELLHEALARELREELGVEVVGDGEAAPRFLFFQEGEKVDAGVRRYAWRSFFYAVPRWRGEPRASGEVEGVRCVPRAELDALLIAPYHDSFRRWLAHGGVAFRSAWRE